MSNQTERKPLPPWFPIACAIFVVAGGALQAWKKLAAPSHAEILIAGISFVAVMLAVAIYVFYWIHRYRVEVRPLSPFERRVRLIGMSCILAIAGIFIAVSLLAR
jgi:hypothetical protein